MICCTQANRSCFARSSTPLSSCHGLRRGKQPLLVIVIVWICSFLSCDVILAFHTPSQVKQFNTLPSSWTKSGVFKRARRQNAEVVRLEQEVTTARLSISQQFKNAKQNLFVSQEQLNNAGPGEAGIGIALAFGIIFALSLSTTDSAQMAEVVAQEGLVSGVAKTSVNQLIESTLPLTATDAVAVVLGESVGGIIGSMATVSVSFVLKKLQPSIRGRGKDTALFTEAVSDSEFFIASSTSLPLLTAAGIPPEVASIVSTVLATAQSEVFRIFAQRREIRIESDAVMQELLEEKNAADEARFAPATLLSKKSEGQANPDDLVPAAESKIDFVDVFSDVTRWLQYDVFKKFFLDRMTWGGIPLEPWIGSALLGVLAATSSQLYADTLYGVFGYGPQRRQDEVRSRNLLDWATVYTSLAISSSVLFGVYELSQRPVSRYIQGMLAGGVDGCIGSEAFDLCMQTYIDTNSPGPSTEAQFRALITNLVMLWQRLQLVAVDTSFDDVKSLVGAWSVGASSFMQHHIPLILSPLGTV